MTSAHEIAARAMDHHRRGQLADAELGYRQALELDPDNADALQLLGTIVAQRGDFAAGIGLVSRALALNPDSKEAHLNLANIYARALRMADAAHHFREVLRRDGDNIQAANGLGGALVDLGHYTEGEPYLRRALALAPKSAPVLLNMGMLMDAQARFEDAIRFYDEVLALQPNHTEAHTYRGVALLLRGRFREGWPEYGWRVRSIPTFFGRFHFPYWRGEPIAGRKILVWTEQGPGDEILFATMIPDLLALGATVIVLCSQRMAPLFERSFPTAHVIGAGQAPSDPSITKGIEFQASFSELGLALRPSFDAFPRAPALLKADAAKTAALRRRYQNAAEGKMLVGISWRSTNNRLETAKTIPLAMWQPVLKTASICFVSLQYGDTREEIARAERDFGARILVDNEVDPLVSLDDFASQTAAMDLVISISNTTVHVGGAVGRPVWALVPSNHGRLWYWFLERQDSPWYPSARLFRQDIDAGWEPVLATIAQHLCEFSRDTRATNEL